MTGTNEYGKALFLLAKEDGKYDEYISDLFLLTEAFKQNEKYISLLDTPAVPKDEKLSLIDDSLGTLNQNIINLVKILCEKHSVYSVFDIHKTFISLYNEEMGIEEVTAITAVPMTDEQKERLKKKLESITEKHIIVKNVIDKNILGGMKLRYSGKQIDGSLKSRLSEFEKKIKSTVIR